MLEENLAPPATGSARQILTKVPRGKLEVASVSVVGVGIGSTGSSGVMGHRECPGTPDPSEHLHVCVIPNAVPKRQETTFHTSEFGDKHEVSSVRSF